MKKQTTKKTAVKKTAPVKKTAVKKTTAKPAGKAVKKETKVDAKLIHQIDWLTADVINGYFLGVDSDILSKAEIKKLIQTTNNHQEIFDYLSVEKNISADFAEFLLFYMHTIVFTGAASTVLKEWNADYLKSNAPKKKK